MEVWAIIVSMVSAILGSNGLLYFIMTRKDKKEEERKKQEAEESAERKMLLGLGHDRIVNQCLKYIERGWISSDEYEDLIKYLYEPYEGMHGNGTAKRLVDEVKKLPVRKMTYIQQAHQEVGVS